MGKVGWSVGLSPLDERAQRARSHSIDERAQRARSHSIDERAQRARSHSIDERAQRARSHSIGSKDRGDGDAIKAAVWRMLVREWNDDLDRQPVTQTAIDWLDDVVTFSFDASPTAHFTLWFNLSVDWPSSLASHWIRGAFALGRLDLDDTLSDAGWRLRQRDDDPPLPSLESQFHRPDPSGHTVRFEIDGAVAHVADENVYMEARLDGERVDTPAVALAMLPEDEQTRIRELLEAKRCACPLCRIAWGNYGLSEPRGRNGHTGEHVLRWPSNGTWRYLAGQDAALWLSDDAYGGARFYVTWDEGRRFELVEKFREAGPLHATPIDGGFLVAHGETWLRSTDGGKRFRRVAGPPGTCTGLVRRGKTIVAWCNESGTAFLHRSADRGKSWRRIASAPVIDHVALGAKRIYALVRKKAEGPSFLARSDDGKAWTHVGPFPFVGQQLLVGRSDDTVMVFGSWLDASGSTKDARWARSTDGGRTWRRGPSGELWRHQAALAHPSGRWFHVAASGQFLQYSDDEGATWQDASDDQPQTLAVDPARERTIFVGGYDRLARLSW